MTSRRPGPAAASSGGRTQPPPSQSTHNRSTHSATNQQAVTNKENVMVVCRFRPVKQNELQEPERAGEVRRENSLHASNRSKSLHSLASYPFVCHFCLS